MDQNIAQQYYQDEAKRNRQPKPWLPWVIFVVVAIIAAIVIASA